ncbi:MAG: dehydrogenase [Candidatus Firestonebacteria bacterium RIFOXYA2_FULL_40_8]|nr:MAG: dehydrogenase [Candidatus Firestonebacteria bacterium RIFOXYA2_FULL_40_8]
MELENRSAIVTGANQGLGLEIAKEYLKEGASILICARNNAKLKEAEKILRAGLTNKQKLIAVQADVSKEADVKNIINSAIKEFKKVDIVVNNAGVYGPKGAIEDVNGKEWIDAVTINLYSVFYMCKYIIPHMKANNYGKIVNLSGGGATAPLPRISAYAASKAAVVRLTETLAKECELNKIDINAIAPGALNTRLIDEVLEAGPEKVGKAFYEKTVKQKQDGGTPLNVGAALSVYLASAKSDGISGRLISAVWDPWKDLEKHKADMQKSDIYTLRRIVPEDRGQKWS